MIINTLRQTPYQLIALTKLLNNKQNAILITDGVGVGKTISAGYIASYFSKTPSGPIIVACPNILVDKWREELITKFKIKARPVRNLDELSTAHDELNYLHKLDENIAYIIPHSIFHREKIKLKFEPILIIIDEIHNFRNPETIAHQNIMKLTEISSVRVGLSATPINNSIQDLINEFVLLLPEIKRETLDCTIGEIWQRKQYDMLSPLMTRFEKENLNIHFAKRKVRNHFVEYENGYIEKIKELIKKRSGRKVTDSYFMDEITLFRLASSSPKAIEHILGKEKLLLPQDDTKLNKLLDICDDNLDEKLIIFCEFRRTAKYLEQTISKDRNVFLISGDTKYIDRTPLLDDFRRSEGGILILTSVGSEGLDLQFCSKIINYDLHWNPMRLEQRIGRIDRVGQKSKNIEIHNFIVSGSVDDKILSILNKKLELVDQSVLSPSAIINVEKVQSSVSEESTLSPSFQSLKSETKESEELIKAIQESSKIKLRDYSIVDKIEKKYCSPDKIQNFDKKGNLPWLNNKSLREWILSEIDHSMDFSELLEIYK